MAQVKVLPRGCVPEVRLASDADDLFIFSEFAAQDEASVESNIRRFLRLAFD